MTAGPAEPAAVAHVAAGREPRAAQPTLRDRLRGGLARIASRLSPRWQVALSGCPPMQRDGQTLDPTLQLLLAARGPVGPAPLTHGTPAEARARLRREVLSIRGRLTQVGTVRDLTVEGGAGPLRARHYAPGTAPDAAAPLLVFYHGGGHMLGDCDTHDETCRLLCRHAHQHVLSVEYRLAPEHPFPAGLRDAVSSFRWAQANARALGANPARVAVGGDSAGANLAAVVCQQTAHDRPPLAQLLIYPPTDGTTTRPSHRLFDGFFLSLADRNAFHENYRGATRLADDDPRLSPLRAPNLGSLAPALIVTAGFDVLRDEGEAYAAALAAAGTACDQHREPALGHGFVQMTGVCAAAHRATVALASRWGMLVNTITVTA